MRREALKARREAAREITDLERALAIANCAEERDAVVHSLAGGAGGPYEAVSLHRAEQYTAVAEPLAMCSFNRPVRPFEIDKAMAASAITQQEQIWAQRHLGILHDAKVLPRTLTRYRAGAYLGP